MKFYRFLLFAVLSLPLSLAAQTGAQKEAILLNASVQASPARITLTWTAQTGTNGYTIYRKGKSDGSWGNSIGTAAASATSYADNSVCETYWSVDAYLKENPTSLIWEALHGPSCLSAICCIPYPHR